MNKGMNCAVVAAAMRVGPPPVASMVRNARQASGSNASSCSRCARNVENGLNGGGRSASSGSGSARQNHQPFAGGGGGSSASGSTSGSARKNQPFVGGGGGSSAIKVACAMGGADAADGSATRVFLCFAKQTQLPIAPVTVAVEIARRQQHPATLQTTMIMSIVALFFRFFLLSHHVVGMAVG